MSVTMLRNPKIRRSGQDILTDYTVTQHLYTTWWVIRYNETSEEGMEANIDYWVCKHVLMEENEK